MKRWPSSSRYGRNCSTNTGSCSTAPVPQAVLDRIRRSHISDYSIHLPGDRLFSCFEYHGDDLAAEQVFLME
jgi:L-rhamnose mutarotase